MRKAIVGLLLLSVGACLAGPMWPLEWSTGGGISVTNLGYYVETGSSEPITWNPTPDLPLGDNGMVILMVSFEADDNLRYLDNVTYDGNAMTEAAGVVKKRSGSYIYYQAAPTNANAQFSMEVGNGGYLGLKLAALYATGIDGLEDTATADRDVAASSPLTAGPIDVTVGSLVIDTATEHYGTGFTAGSGLANTVINDSTDSFSGAATYELATSTNVSTTWTGADVNCGAFSIVLAGFNAVN